MIFFKNFCQKQHKPITKEQLAKISLYKRISSKMGIPFQSIKSQKLLQESINAGYADSFFHLIDQCQTQNDPTYCGPSTMTVILNALGIDPKKKWKGIWRWYFEEIVKCADLGNIKTYGMTLEEFSLICRCNSMFTETFRPDENEEETLKEMMDKIEGKKEKTRRVNNNEDKDRDRDRDKGIKMFYDPYLIENQNKIVSHNFEENKECKNSFEIEVKKANLDVFRIAVKTSTKSDSLYMVCNTSRKALNQTGDGHFCPVAAFNPMQDQVLLLDSARFKYSSMWFKSDDLYKSLFPIDKATSAARGFLLCSKYFYLCPPLCRKSFDSQTTTFIKNYLKSENFANLNEILEFFNKDEIKSNILFYVHDVENRVSYTMNYDENLHYIRYSKQNINLKKKDIFEKITPISEKLKEQIVLKNENLISLLSFTHYLESEFFLEILTLFILSFNKVVRFLDFDDNLTKEIQNLYNDPLLKNEIYTISQILGL